MADIMTIEDLREELKAGLSIVIKTRHYGEVKVGNVRQFVEDMAKLGKKQLEGRIDIQRNGNAILYIYD